jgi:aquaporin Z
MNKKLWPLLCLETIGVFGLVLFSSGLACINEMTSPLPAQQLGLVGIALGQGLIFAALLALTAPVTGGYLNPAITVMLWVFNRVETPRAVALIVAQLIGSILAAGCLSLIFVPDLLRDAKYGAPHVNERAYPKDAREADGGKKTTEPKPALSILGQATTVTGTALELTLTFFVVFAIFALAGADALKLGLVAGMIVTVCALFGYPLTGAAMNPARWLGPTVFESYRSGHVAWADSLVYLAGPILGAILGGAFVFKVYGRSSG